MLRDRGDIVSQSYRFVFLNRIRRDRGDRPVPTDPVDVTGDSLECDAVVVATLYLARLRCFTLVWELPRPQVLRDDS